MTNEWPCNSQLLQQQPGFLFSRVVDLCDYIWIEQHNIPDLLSSVIAIGLQTLAYLECAKGGGPGVWGTEVPQWGPWAKKGSGERIPPEADAFLLLNA